MKLCKPISILTILAISGLATPAFANTIGAFGVSTTAQGGSQGCGAGAHYDTPSGGSLGQSTSPGNISIGDCGTSVLEGTTGPAGLTSSFGRTAQGALQGSANHPVSSSDYAAADLASAKVHGFAQTNAGYSAFSESEFWDTLTFNIPGATDSTLTNVLLSLIVDGTSTGVGTVSPNAAIVDLQIGPSTGCFCTHGNDVVWGMNKAWFTAPDFFVENSSFVTWSVDPASVSSGGFAALGTVTLRGANPMLWLALDMQLEPGGPPHLGDPGIATLDFSNTGALSLSVPTGVTFNSASGVFLSAGSGPSPAPVPEPATITLLGAGLLGGSFVARRRQRRYGHQAPFSTPQR